SGVHSRAGSRAHTEDHTHRANSDGEGDMRSVGMSTHPQRRKAAGFSLIEVLIAILILAVGLLGFALMQTTTLRYTQSSDYRTRATNLAYELLDQMRVNRLSAADYVAAGFAAKTVSDRKSTRLNSSHVKISYAVFC